MSADLRAQLQATLGASYTIERELGGGGMSRVFAAIETALRRRVVIKVLLPELAAEVSAQRFAREIRLAASLQQANIVPVLAAGEIEGLPYYTMPFVDGRSLRDALTRGSGLPMPNVIGVLRDVARALAYAHDHGVVHRDIKPENVLLSGDAAVVTDFGIAKALAAAGSQRPERAESAPALSEGEGRDLRTLTSLGMSLGTPAYMAPEQIAADPQVDHRADLYSFGCLAYELLTGASPFHGRTAQQLLTAHLAEPPVPVGEKRPDCPPAIAGLVMRCLAKEPAERPQSAREILTELDVPTQPATALTRWRNRLSRRQRRGMIAGVAAVVVAVLVVPARAWLQGENGTQLESVAVIPFTNVGGDSTQEYLAEGMADELATSLGKVAGVRVISRTLSARYRGRSDVDAKEIGRTLAVRYVLTGRVRRFGRELRVSAQLVSAADNSETWSADYVRAPDEAFAVQDSITRAVGLTLQRRLTGAAASAGIPATASIGTRDPEAYDLYLRGRLLLERRGPGVALAVEKFEQAIARDSGFARAHAGLGVALELLPYFSAVRASSVRDRALRAARHALELDSTQSEAYTALGLAHMHAYEWSRSAEAHGHAVTLGPSEASAHVQYGRLLLYTGQYAAAKREFDRARSLDPYSPTASAWVGKLLTVLGREAEGRAEIKRALELDSLNPPALFMAAQAYLEAGSRDSAKLFADRLTRRVPSWRAAAAQLHALLGEREAALSVLRELESGPPEGEHFAQILMVALGLGDTARVLDALERATDVGGIWPVWYPVSSREYDAVRSSPRFAAVVRRVGLDERIVTSPDGGRP